MTSRIDSAPPSSSAARSGPSRRRCRRAAGAPNAKASSRKPNFSWASSSDRPMTCEDALLHVAAVDTDRAAADLVAVADHVVGVGERRPGVGVEGVEELGLRRGEGVVDGGPRARADRDVAGGDRLGRRLEQRRVDDPEELQASRRSGRSACRSRGGRRRAGPRGLGGPGGEEDAVTGLRTDVRGQAGELGLGEVLGHRVRRACRPPGRGRRPGPSAPRCLAHSCQASSCLRGWLAPPGMTTAPT
jgi:hypothetical protein